MEKQIARITKAIEKFEKDWEVLKAEIEQVMATVAEEALLVDPTSKNEPSEK